MAHQQFNLVGLKKLLRSSVNWMPQFMPLWIKHIPGVAAIQRRVVSQILSGEPFVHTINAGPAAGLQFEVTLLTDKAIWLGTYESKFASAISEGVREGAICYDVGGYRGYMAAVMALAGASKVFVFEPLRDNQCALQRLCELNGRLAIEIQTIALGALDGVIRLQVMSDRSMGKLATSPFQRDAPKQAEIDVEIRRIDSLVEGGEIPPPNLIKIDVEGAEMDVLQGAGGVIKSYRPKIFLEAHSAELQVACSRELAKQGYVIRNLDAQVANAKRTCHLIATPL